MTRIASYLVAVAFAVALISGCKQTNSPNEPPGVVFTKAGAGSTYHFDAVETDSATGTTISSYTIDWTVAADNLTVLGRSPARMFLANSSATLGTTDTLYLIYEANGDISYHRTNTVANATWIRLPTSGGSGDDQVLLDSTVAGAHDHIEIKTFFEGTENIPVNGASVSSQKIDGQTTATSTMSGMTQTQIVDDHAWYAPSIGFATKEFVDSHQGTTETLTLTSYQLH